MVYPGPSEDLQAHAKEFSEDDDRYFITYPGEQYLLSFNLPGFKVESEATYFIRSKGYYIEWLRKEWLKRPQSDSLQNFELNDKTILHAAQLWASKRDEFEKKFYDLKVPLLQEVGHE